MSRLFSANMMRLRKSKIFWLEEIFMVGYALFVYISAASTMKSRGIFATGTPIFLTYCFCPVLLWRCLSRDFSMQSIVMVQSATS